MYRAIHRSSPARGPQKSSPCFPFNPRLDPHLFAPRGSIARALDRSRQRMRAAGVRRDGPNTTMWPDHPKSAVNLSPIEAISVRS